MEAKRGKRILGGVDLRSDVLLIITLGILLTMKGSG